MHSPQQAVRAWFRTIVHWTYPCYSDAARQQLVRDNCHRSGNFDRYEVFIMSTIQEITEVLPNLSIDELQHIERAIHNLYRVRRERIIYDDNYGIWTEQDQSSVAAAVFELLDKAEN